MQPRSSRALVLLLVISAVLFAPVGEALARPARGDAGRIVMKFSPVLGINVGLSVTIDGRLAGPITKGHVFERYVSPGPHQISVYRNGRVYDAWHGRLNVRPGHTYAFIVKYTVNQVVLERVPRYQRLARY